MMKTFALLPLVLLAGCAAVGPDFDAPDVPAPASVHDWHGGAPALRDTGLTIGVAQPYARFDDPVLRGLLQRAAAQNHDLRTAALRFAQSRLQRAVAAGAAGPQLGTQAGATRQRQSESGSATRMLEALAPPENRDAMIGILASPFNVYQAGFDASWEPDFWGRVRRTVEAADAGIAQADALLREAQLAVAVEVARSYYELRSARVQQRLAKEDIAAGEELLQLAEQRSRGGLATDIDVVRQQALLAEQRGNLPALLEQEAQAENAIALLVGTAPGTLHAALAEAAPDGDGTFGKAPDLALGMAGDIVAGRPDIAASAAALHAATANIGIATADLYPRVTLGVSFGFESTAGGKFGEWGSRQWSVGPSLSLPLFDGGVRRATVDLRKLEQQQAAVAWQKAVLQAWQEVDNALSSYAAERMRREQWQRREDAAAVALDLAATRYRQGLTDALPVLDAQRTLLAARRARVQSDAALTLQLLAICKATGTPPAA